MGFYFISYSRQSQSVAKELAEDIGNLGPAVWIDEALTGGRAWWAQILSKIRECDALVFVLEPAALQSQACMREYSYAASLGKAILPVLISEGISANLMPSALSQIQFVDYRKRDRAAAFRLAKAVASVPGPLPLPEPLPPPPEVPISYIGALGEKIETPSLKYEEQAVILVDLKKSLDEPRTGRDARLLLEKMRHRRDLFAVFAEEIDELLSRKATPEVKTKYQPKADEPEEKGEEIELLPPPAPRMQPAPSSGRTRCVGFGALVGFGLGMVSSILLWVVVRLWYSIGSYSSLLGFVSTMGGVVGAVAGLMGARDRKLLAGAAVGAGVAALLELVRYFAQGSLYLLEPFFFGAVGPAIGVAVRAAIRWREQRRQ